MFGIKVFCRNFQGKWCFFRACHQLTDFVTRTALFENRIAEYMDVFEKRKPKGHRNVRFAVQKIIIDDMP